MTYHRSLMLGTKVVYQVYGDAVEGYIVGFRDLDGHFIYGIRTRYGYLETDENWVTEMVN